MPRTARADLGGYCFHVLNRGNARAEVFHKDDDYAAFVRGLDEASLRVPMRLGRKSGRVAREDCCPRAPTDPDLPD